MAYSAMTQNETKLEKAGQHVAEAKRIVARQRQQIVKLKASGISTLDAEQTLQVFTATLETLEHHEQHLREHTLKEWRHLREHTLLGVRLIGFLRF